MRRWTRVVLVLVAAASGVAFFWIHAAREEAASRAEHDALAAERREHAMAGLSETNLVSADRRKAAAHLLEAIAIDHRLREPPSGDRYAIIGAAYALRRYSEHLVIESKGPIRDAAFKADGAKVALVGDEPVLRVVDLTDGNRVTTSPLPEAASSVRWKNGLEIEVVTRSGVELRTDDGKTLVARSPLRDTDAGAAVPFSGEAVGAGRLARVASRRIIVTNAAGDREDELEGHTGEILALRFSPHDSKVLVSTSADHTATIWTLGAPGLVRTVRVAGEGLQTPRFSVTGDIVVVGTRGVDTYDGVTGTPRRYFSASPAVTTANLYEDRAVIVSKNGDIALWDAKTTKQIKVAVGLASRGEDVALARDVPLALACRASDCTLVDGDAREVMKMTGGGGKVLSPNGKLAATSDSSGNWKIFDTTTKQELGAIAGSPPILRAFFAGSRFVIADAASVRLHATNGKLITTLHGRLPEGRQALSEDGSVVRTIEGGIAHYYRASGQKRGSIELGNKLDVLSPNGRFVAVFDPSELKIFTVEGRVVDSNVRAIAQTESAVSWSANGQLLATGGRDHTLRLHDIYADNTDYGSVPVDDRPDDLRLSRDGTHILTSDDTHRIVRLYDLSLDSAISVLCRVAAQDPAIKRPADVCPQ